MSNSESSAQQQQLYNKELQESQKLLQQQSRIISTQVDMIAQMVSSVKQMDFSRAKNQTKEFANSLFGVKDAVEKISEDGHSAFEHLNETTKESIKTTYAFQKAVDFLTMKHVRLGSTGVEAFFGLNQGLKFSLNMTKSLISYSGTLIKTVLHLGAAIVTAPFKMLKGLIHMADQGGSNELAEALEKIREEFGYLRKTAGGAIIELSRSMKGELANTGLSVYRIFGNLAQRLQYFQKYAHALGPIFDSIYANVGPGGAEALGAYNKALGLTEEGLKGVAQRALTTGRTVNEINRELANYAIQLSSAFNVTMKEVSRDVGTMMADFQHFGHLGTKALTQVAVYARRLGLEVKALGGLMDKWMNFEDAATGAAQLSQAFGLNIDAISMMRAQDPAEKIEQLRKAFFRAGKSVETMTYQERRLLAQQTGLDDAAISLAFSLKSQGMSYDQVTRKGAQAQRHQLTQAEALERLSGAIERLVRSGSGDGLGFVDKFFKGFSIGIRRSREFRQIMRNIRRDLRSTLRAGVESGRAFVKAFPGIKDFFGSLADFFEPRRFREMLGKVKGAFHEFFDALAGKDPRALPEFARRLHKGFMEYFDSRSPAGRRFLDGSKRIFEAFANIANGLLKKAIEGVTRAVRFVTDLLTGRTSLRAIQAEMESSGGFLGKLLKAAFDGIPEMSKKFGESVMTMLKAGWERFGPRITNFLSGWFFTVLGTSLAASFTRGFFGAIAGLFVRGAATTIKRAIGTSGVGHALSEAGSEVAARSRQLSEAGNGLRGRRRRGGMMGGMVTESVQEAGHAAEAARRSNFGRADVYRLLLAAALIGVGMFAVVQGMKSIILWVRENHVSLDEVAKAALVMGGAATVMIAAAGATAAIGGASRLMVGVNPVVVGAAVGTMIVVTGAMIGAAWLTIQAVKGFPMDAIAKSIVVMGAMSGMMIAAAGMTAVSGALGAVIVATDGLAVAAIIAGLATMGIVLAAMVEETMSIIRKIDRFRPLPGFNEKAATFVSIVNSLGTFTSSFMAAMSVAVPGVVGTISSVIFGQNPARQIHTTFSKMAELVNTVGDRMQAIIAQIMNWSSSMTTEQIERGRSIASTLVSIGEFAKSLQPGSELLRDSSAWFEGSDVVSKINGTTVFITALADSVMTTMMRLTPVIRDISGMNWSEQTIRGTQVFTGLLKGIGDLSQALLPRGTTLEQINRSRDFAGALNHLGAFMRSMVDGLINSHIFQSVSGIVSGIATEVRNINPTQVGILNRVAPIAETAIGALSSTATMFGNMSNLLRGTNSVSVDANLITQLTGLVSTVFEKLVTFIPTMLNNIKAIRLTPSDSRDITGKLATIRSVMETVSSIPTAFQSMTSGAAAGADRLQYLQTGLDTVSTFMLRIFDKTSATSSGGAFYTGLQLVAAWKAPEGLSNGVTQLQQASTAISRVAEFSRTLAGTIQSAQETAERIKGGTVSRIVTSIQQMVTEVNEVSNQLGNVDVPNINMSLRRMAHDIGLGENGQFVVHRGQFTVNVNVNVTMDSRDLQTTLVQTATKTPVGPRLATTTS